MGTWSAGILGNDTSAQTHESFFEQYDAGKSIDQIVKAVEKEMRASLAMDEDRTNVELALALALWECKALDAARLRRVRAIATSGEDVAAWTSLDADAAFLSKRKKALTTLLTKLSKAPAEARPRRGKPRPLSTEFRPGTCFAVHHDGRYVTFWIASHYAGRDSGDFGIVCLDLESDGVPTLEQCERAPAMGMRPEGGGKWRGTQVSLYYDTRSRERVLAAMKECCIIVGRTRVFKTKCMLWSSGGWGGPVTEVAALRAKLLKIRALNAEESRRHRLGQVLDLLMGKPTKAKLPRRGRSAP